MTRNLDNVSGRILPICTLALGVAIIGLSSLTSSAATISYGDFGPVPPGVSFLDVEESSVTAPVPLYGPPTPFPIGLDFDPKDFAAVSTNDGTSFVNGQLNFTVMSSVGISSLNLFERGDFTLTGTGTSSTDVEAGASILATVTEINGSAVAPIDLTPVNGSVTFDLANNAGISQPWSLGVGLNVAGQLGPGQVATKIEIAINNSLAAVSEATTGAFIGKEDFRVNVQLVPEPATTALLLGASIACAMIRRRR